MLSQFSQIVIYRGHSEVKWINRFLTLNDLNSARSQVEYVFIFILFRFACKIIIAMRALRALVKFPIFKIARVAKNRWRITNKMASIWRGNILGYFSLDIICYSFSEQIISRDKYPSIIPCPIEAIAYIHAKSPSLGACNYPTFQSRRFHRPIFFLILIYCEFRPPQDLRDQSHTRI